MEALGFGVVGYGCATCIGNSGPLPSGLDRAAGEGQSVVAAVLSGNRNFEARIHPAVRANYLASPPLVVAYALAGTVDIDLTTEPLGTRPDGRPRLTERSLPRSDVWLRWSLRPPPELFRRSTAAVEESEAAPMAALARASMPGRRLTTSRSRLPRGVRPRTPTPADIRGARILALLVIRDHRHISPAGAIARNEPGGAVSHRAGSQPRGLQH